MSRIPPLPLWPLPTIPAYLLCRAQSWTDDFVLPIHTARSTSPSYHLMSPSTWRRGGRLSRRAPKLWRSPEPARSNMAKLRVAHRSLSLKGFPEHDRHATPSSWKDVPGPDIRHTPTYTPYHVRRRALGGAPGAARVSGPRSSSVCVGSHAPAIHPAAAMASVFQQPTDGGASIDPSFMFSGVPSPTRPRASTRFGTTQPARSKLGWAGLGSPPKDRNRVVPRMISQR